MIYSKNIKLTVNYPALFVIIIYPLILASLAVLYHITYVISRFEIISLIVTYYIVNISVGVGLHRLWSHNAFKTTRWVELVLALLSAATLQGPILAWVSDHMIHHRYTDQHGDPHSPLKYKNKFMGFLWSHIGWMIFCNNHQKKINKMAIAKLGRNKIVLWQFRNYWKIAISMNTIVPLSIGYIVGGDIRHAAGAFIFMGIGRAFQQQATFCVNSLVHMNIGSKEYYNGTARDVWWLFFILLGENWHNFHHAFANDYRNGHKWYHLDIHKWIIKIMSKVGLAKDLVVTSKLRIDLMKEQIKVKSINDLQKKVCYIEVVSLKIQNLALEKLKKAETSTVRIASNIQKNLYSIADRAKYIIEDTKDLKLSSDNEKKVLLLLAKLDRLRQLAQESEIRVP